MIPLWGNHGLWCAFAAFMAVCCAGDTLGAVYPAVGPRSVPIEAYDCSKGPSVSNGSGLDVVIADREKGHGRVKSGSRRRVVFR